MIWLSAGVLAACYSLPLSTFVSIAFFIVFFVAFVAHYWRMVYVVDEYGVTVGASEQNHFRWEDIEQVRPSDIPLAGYYVSTKRGGFMLSSFVTQRRRLLDTIIARAGLFPMPR